MFYISVFLYLQSANNLGCLCWILGSLLASCFVYFIHGENSCFIAIITFSLIIHSVRFEMTFISTISYFISATMMNGPNIKLIFFLSNIIAGFIDIEFACRVLFILSRTKQQVIRSGWKLTKVINNVFIRKNNNSDFLENITILLFWIFW